MKALLLLSAAAIALGACANGHMTDAQCATAQAVAAPAKALVDDVTDFTPEHLAMADAAAVGATALVGALCPVAPTP